MKTLIKNWKMQVIDDKGGYIWCSLEAKIPFVICKDGHVAFGNPYIPQEVRDYLRSYFKGLEFERMYDQVA